jgi:hypothetical protein
MSDSSSVNSRVSTVGGKGDGGRGHEGWRASLVRAPLEALIEELRERDAIREQAKSVRPAPRGAATAVRAQLAKKKRTTAEQWALLAATDAELVASVRATQRAIYGEDGRVDWGRASAEVQALGASVAALFWRRDLLEVAGRYQVMTTPFAQVFSLAPGEAFADQPCGAFGTAWVIDEHHMVTAGHCVPRGGVEAMVCVFGFAANRDGEVASSFDAEQVAFPSAALSSRQLDEEGDGDWAVLRFEQALAAPPLRVRGSAVEVGEPVWMLGYPCGIPLKYAPGALVTRHKNDDRFLATLDAFAGNSGSPVFDAQHQVIGMLVRGAEDWIPRRDGSMVAAVYPPEALGEEVMKLDRFLARRPSQPSLAQEQQPAMPGMSSSPAASHSTAAMPTAHDLGSAGIAAPGATGTSGSAGVSVRQRMRRAATTERLAIPLNAHALVIQIAAYPQMPLPDVQDAEDLAEVLCDPELCHYPLSHVMVLRDARATRACVLAALRALVAAADEHATVLLYFSGHGGQRGETTYLLPYDCDPAALARTAISARELREELAELRAGNVLLIFDCCHAGGLEGEDCDDDSKEVVLPGLTEAAADELVRGRGWALFASSHAGQHSFVQRGARNGIFTRHLLDGLRGGRASDDGYVRVFDLFEYLQPRVVREEPRQQPMFKGALSESFAIARHRGGAVGAVPRTDDGFLYHALICYAKADAAWVREELLPPLRAAGLRVATTQELVEPGLERVVGLERGLTQARRTLVVMSQAFLQPEREADLLADHAVLQRKDAELRNGRYSLIPIYVEDRDLLREVPTWLASLRGVQLGDAAGSHVDVEEEMARLIRGLTRPLPRR